MLNSSETFVLAWEETLCDNPGAPTSFLLSSSRADRKMLNMQQSDPNSQIRGLFLGQTPRSTCSTRASHYLPLGWHLQQWRLHVFPALCVTSQWSYYNGALHQCAAMMGNLSDSVCRGGHTGELGGWCDVLDTGLLSVVCFSCTTGCFLVTESDFSDQFKDILSIFASKLKLGTISWPQMLFRHVLTQQIKCSLWGQRPSSTQEFNFQWMFLHLPASASEIKSPVSLF